MPAERAAELNVGHPAPDRGRVGLSLLMFGILGAPIAWALQLLAGSAIAGMACLSATGTAIQTPTREWTDWADAAMVAVNIAALLAGALALIASFVALRRTGSRYAGGHDSVMEAGEGRSRYLAIWGIWTSVLFLCAIAFSTISVFWSELCAL